MYGGAEDRSIHWQMRKSNDEVRKSYETSALSGEIHRTFSLDNIAALLLSLESCMQRAPFAITTSNRIALWVAYTMLNTIVFNYIISWRARHVHQNTIFRR